MIFTTVFYNTLTMYFHILQGFVAGKFLKVDRATIATTLFYLITPFVFITTIPKAKLDASSFMLPVVVFVVCCFACLVTYNIGKKIVKDGTANIAAFSAGNCNAGFYGVPVALLVFSEAEFANYLTGILGVVFCENTVGYLISARGKHTFGEALRRLVKLPILWGAVIGVFLNLIHFQFPKFLDALAQNIRGAYVVLGIMVIGLGISGLKRVTFDPKFLTVTIGTKYILWPAVCFMLVQLDMHFIQFFSVLEYNILMLISIMPLATNTVIIATLLDLHPEKMATAVLVSMLLALFYVPFMISKLLYL